MTKEVWLAIKNKDKSYDGKFVYVVKSTGIICRPSCEKKMVSPKNILVFDSVEDAVKASYRPCKRCHPDQEEWKGARQELADAVGCEIRNHYTQDFSLEELAGHLHVNKYHLLRTFHNVTGETPLQYHNRYRCERAEELLKHPDLAISYIALETGYNSASHFSRVFSKVVGMSPTKYRQMYLEELDS